MFGSQPGSWSPLDTWLMARASMTHGTHHDTIDAGYMEVMASRFPRRTYLSCPDGSHLATDEDQATYCDGIVDFIGNVKQGAPSARPESFTPGGDSTRRQSTSWPATVRAVIAGRYFVVSDRDAQGASPRQRRFGCP